MFGIRYARLHGLELHGATVQTKREATLGRPPIRELEHAGLVSQ